MIDVPLSLCSGACMRAFAAGYAALVCQAMAIASATQGVLGFLRTAAPSASRPARAALVPHRLQVVPRPDYVSSVATLLTHLSLLRTSSPVGHIRGDMCHFSNLTQMPIVVLNQGKLLTPALTSAGRKTSSRTLTSMSTAESESPYKPLMHASYV